jgi:hypothetical protein
MIGLNLRKCFLFTCTTLLCKLTVRPPWLWRETWTHESPIPIPTGKIAKSLGIKSKGLLEGLSNIFLIRDKRMYIIVKYVGSTIEV